MDIINPSLQTKQLPIGVTYAKLEAPEAGLNYDFLVNPEEIVWQDSSNFKEIPVLYTGQPQLSYQNSQTSLSLPKIYLWTSGQSGRLTEVVASLRSMTKPEPGKNQPPILRLTWGNLVEPRLFMKSLSIREQQWRSGTLTSAVCSMDFARLPVPPQIVKSDVIIKLSDRERREYAVKIGDLLRKDRNRSKALGINPATGVTVGSDGSIFYGGKRIFGIKDKFPDLVKKSHSSLS